MSGISPGLALWKIAFQLSPIFLTGGVAKNIPGNTLPIIAITEALNFAVGLLSGGEDLNLDEFFANYTQLPGGTLVDQDFGHYPFANQNVAANAVIANPLTISLRMDTPVREVFGYATKLATFAALKVALATHNAAGGTYTVATPSWIYQNCLLRRLSDVSNGASHQAQNAWQWDFEQPLLTLQDAQGAQNSLMSRISSGTAIDGDPTWSGLSPNVGSSASIASPSVVPASANSPGAIDASALGFTGL